MPITKSPLRYPGGKTQLAEFVANIINENNILDCIYIEPFSGGAGVAMELLLTNKVHRVVLNDYDKSIYAIWYSILNHTEKLIDLIEKTDVNIDNWHRQKEIHEKYKNYRNSIENGFSTLFLNRTNRSGIINAGPIGGYEQLSKYKIDCRFNKKKIIEKIREIADRKDDIDLYQKDTIKLIDIISEKYPTDNSFIFFDPPYYEQGNKLYTNFYKHYDHVNLSKAIASLESYYWITTYDKAPQIYKMYKEYDKIQDFKYELRYSAQTKRRASEFIFASSPTNLISHGKVELSII